MNTLVKLCLFKAPSFGVAKTRIPSSSFHAGRYALGLEEFIEVRTANDTSTNGRAWTPADLRKKVRGNEVLHSCTCLCSISQIFYLAFVEL
jgi:hypothetical protein